MARKQADDCMFCAPNPCACAKRPAIRPTIQAQHKAPVAPPAPTPTPVVPTVPKISAAKVLTVSPRPATTKPAASPTVRPNLSGVKQVSTDPNDQLMRNALTALAGADLLHRDELVKHRAKIDLPDHKVDAMIWKQDRRDQRV